VYHAVPNEHVEYKVRTVCMMVRSSPVAAERAAALLTHKRLSARTLEIDPKATGVYWNLGATYESKGDRQRAIADYRRALAIDPKHQASRDALKDLKVAP